MSSFATSTSTINGNRKRKIEDNGNFDEVVNKSNHVMDKEDDANTNDGEDDNERVRNSVVGKEVDKPSNNDDDNAKENDTDEDEYSNEINDDDDHDHGQYYDDDG